MPSNSHDRDLERLTRQQETLRQVIESISEELELRPLLTQIVRLACELIGAQRGSVGLVDEACEVMRTEAAFHMPENELGSEATAGIGLAGAVLLRKEPVWLGRYGELDTTLRDELSEDTVIGVPIFWRRDLIGFIGIGADAPHRFKASDVEMLQLFARHAAIAIHNAKLVEAAQRRSARIETLSEVSQLISASLSIQKILKTVVEAIRDRLGCQSAGLLLVDPNDPKQLVLLDRRGWTTEVKVGQHVQSLDEGIVGAAARERRALLIPDVRKDPRHLGFPGPGSERILSEIAVPIEHHGKLLGVLNVESEDRLNQEDLAGLQVVADQLGIAIENASLFTQTQDALSDMRRLFETSRALTVTADVESAALAYLSQFLLKALPCSELAILTTNPEAPQCDLVARLTTIPRTVEAIHHTLQFKGTQEALFIDDLTASRHQLPKHQLGELEEYSRERGYPSVAVLPLNGSILVGFLVLFSGQPKRWSETELRVFSLTSPSLAMTLESRREQQNANHRSQQLAIIEERHRLARDLHDSVSQLLFSVTLIAQSLESAWQRDSTAGAQRVQRLLEVTSAAQAEMRALLFELRPTRQLPPNSSRESLQEGGLVEALRLHLRLVNDGRAPGTSEHDEPQLELEAQTYQRQNPQVEEALLRISQEAIANVHKHAKAKRCSILLATRESETRLMIRDDGRGLREAEPPSTDGASQGSGLGLISMRERAESIGGSFHLTECKGGGTQVLVRVKH